MRHVMGTFVSGVTVVSTVWQSAAHAMTATAFSAVSLDPPLVLVCVSKQSRFHAAVLGAARWAVSLLRDEQERIARQFSNRGGDWRTQFDDGEHRRAAVAGAPSSKGA